MDSQQTNPVREIVKIAIQWFFRIGHFSPYETLILGLYFGWCAGVALTVLLISAIVVVFP